MTYYFLNGLSMGLLIAMPFGAIDVLCIRNSLCWGIRYGFILGLGVAFADALCAGIAGFGLTKVKLWLNQHTDFVQIVGGLFLCFLGLYQLRFKTINPNEPLEKPHLASVFSLGFLLIATNPSTFFSFLGIFAAFGTSLHKENLEHAALILIGIFSGSTIWWLALSSGSSIFRNLFALNHLRWLSATIGTTFILLGVSVLFHVLYS